MTRGRFAAFSLTVVAVAAAAVLGLPRARRWGEERLRRSIESRGTALFGGPVRIERLHIELVPPSVHLESVQAEREGNRGSQALVAADEVSVRAALLTFLRAQSGPFAVKMKRPRIALRLAEGRSLSPITRSRTASSRSISQAVRPSSWTESRSRRARSRTGS